MKPTLIGYFPKRTASRPEWLKASRVEQICSVSNCVSDGPDDWGDQWMHNDNELFLFDEPEVALSLIPANLRHEFDLYAYFMYPVVFDQGMQKPFEIPTILAKPIDADFQFLGFDAVSRSLGTMFECSPLSCCHKAEQIDTNCFCLWDDLPAAFAGAIMFSKSGCEPGPYHVLQVWKQSKL